MDEPQKVDPIIECHRRSVDLSIRLKIGYVFNESSSWSEGGLKLALASRCIAMDDFWRHCESLGIRRARITNPNGWHWWMYYVPDNWNPLEFAYDT